MILTTFRLAGGTCVWGGQILARQRGSGTEAPGGPAADRGGSERPLFLFVKHIENKYVMRIFVRVTPSCAPRSESDCRRAEHDVHKGARRPPAAQRLARRRVVSGGHRDVMQTHRLPRHRATRLPAGTAGVARCQLTVGKTEPGWGEHADRHRRRRRRPSISTSRSMRRSG